MRVIDRNDIFKFNVIIIFNNGIIITLIRKSAVMGEGKNRGKLIYLISSFRS